MQDEVMIQQANAASIQDEIIQAQNVAKDLEGRVAELEAETQHTNEELSRMKEEHVAALDRHEKEMVELREKEALAKTLAVEEFKSLENYRRLWKKQVPRISTRTSTYAKSRSNFFILTLTSKTSKLILTWSRRMKRRKRMSWIPTYFLVGISMYIFLW